MPEQKLCECGCGKPAPISKYTDKRTGAVRGQPTRFIRGHGIRRPGNPARVGAARENARRAASVEHRRAQVAEMYERDVPYVDIATALGVSKAVINQDVRWLRSNGKLGYRNTPLAEQLSGEQADQVERLWRVRRLSAREIGEQFGWDITQTQNIVAGLRAEGRDLPRRAGELPQIDSEEKRKIKRVARKRKAASDAEGDLTEVNKVVLRVMEAARRPMGALEIFAFLRHCGESVSTRQVDGRLNRLRALGLVERVAPEQRRWFERRWRWFVPLEQRQTAQALTLADAERETELAALIESQEDELQRGDWIDSEKGHWADKSIDAPLTADGFTILDTLADQDDVLTEMGQAA